MQAWDLVDASADSVFAFHPREGLGAGVDPTFAVFLMPRLVAPGYSGTHPRTGRRYWRQHYFGKIEAYDENLHVSSSVAGVVVLTRSYNPHIVTCAVRVSLTSVWMG